MADHFHSAHSDKAIEKERDDDKKQDDNQSCLHSRGALTALALNRHCDNDNRDYQQQKDKNRDRHGVSGWRMI
jgi:hypothetical protein